MTNGITYFEFLVVIAFKSNPLSVYHLKIFQKEAVVLIMAFINDNDRVGEYKSKIETKYKN